MICADNSIVNDEDENDHPEVESQDEDDMGHGARPGGGFTSVVSTQHGSLSRTLTYIEDSLKGNHTAWPISTPEEAVGS